MRQGDGDVGAGTHRQVDVGGPRQRGRARIDHDELSRPLSAPREHTE